MTGAGLQDRRDDFLDRWPAGKALDNALRTSQNRTPLFYFAEAHDADLGKCTWVLGRLGVDLEKRFGVSSEVLILFTPYHDLQRRTYNALAERLREEVIRQQMQAAGQVRFTPDPSVAFLCAPDPLLEEKVERWNAEGGGSLVAAIPMSSGDPSQVRNSLVASLHAVLSERDLYRGRNPVTGNDFFGREEVLRALRAHFKDGHSIGLFGLRRSGKTSVVQEFRRRNAGQGFAVVISDLEATASLDELPEQICADLNSSLRELRTTDPDVWIGSPEEQVASTFVELGSRIRKVAEKNSRFTFVFAFDEIESLVPLIRRDPLVVRTFLGAIRRAAQGSNNVCLLLTGVTSRFFRDSMLEPAQEIENPMLGFVDEYFLGPFEPHETANLLRKLGRGMLLTWDDDALTAVHQAAGGYPFLVRDLATAARRIARIQPSENGGNAVITEEVVATAIGEWRDQAADLWSQLMQTLRMHHELMAEMASADSDSAVQEWLRLGDEAERAARSLEGLGLLVASDGNWCRSASLVAMQALRRPKTAEMSTLQHQRSVAASLQALLVQPEGQFLEFKSTARVNLHTSKSDDKMKKAFVKSVAGFLNAEGGTLVIGAADDGTTVGVGADVSASSGSRDKYELYLRDSLRASLGDQIVATHLRVEFVEFDAELVVRVDVQPARDGVWYEDNGVDVFYVRSGNQTLAMPNRDVNAYLSSRTAS